MSKYIDPDVLKAEIEKRMHICDGVFERDSDTYYQGKAVAYQETLSFINSLKQEQPSEDLEKKCATCAYFDTQTRRNGYCNAGAEKVVVATDTICELWKPYDMGNSEKKQILKGDRLTELDKLYKQAKRELEWFKEGKRQGKEEMLKDAVEGIVVGVYPLKRATEIQYGVLYPKGVLPHKNSDKVKIVIVPIKEDKK